MSFDKLNKINSELQTGSLSDLKSVFLDNMSHELRTPVTVILGYAGILYEELDDPELKEMAEIILKSSNRLTEALNLILDEADIETNRLKITLVTKNLSELVKNKIALFKQDANDKNLKLNIQIESNDLYAEIDERMFSKVVENLLNNAIKFTQSGGILVKLSKDADKILFEVIDTGIGIPNELKDLIFEAFRQVSEGMNRKYQGIGLGLSVSKKFVELLNGQIDFTSEEGKGSHFRVMLPFVPAPE